MNLFHKEKHLCDLCGEKFNTNSELIKHARHIHHHPIVKCLECGMEFIHEKDRLHHAREEHEKKVELREHKDRHRNEQENLTPQEEVDLHNRKFSDNF
jgi:uncharacterized Zn finger protein